MEEEPGTTVFITTEAGEPLATEEGKRLVAGTKRPVFIEGSGCMTVLVLFTASAFLIVSLCRMG
jgi:hypothetical protein